MKATAARNSLLRWAPFFGVPTSNSAKNRLSDLLGVPVDPSPEHTLKQAVAERAAVEAVRAF